MRAPVVARVGGTLRALSVTGSSRCNAWKGMTHIWRASNLIAVGAHGLDRACWRNAQGLRTTGRADLPIPGGSGEWRHVLVAVVMSCQVPQPFLGCRGSASRTTSGLSGYRVAASSESQHRAELRSQASRAGSRLSLSPNLHPNGGGVASVVRFASGL